MSTVNWVRTLKTRFSYSSFSLRFVYPWILHLLGDSSIHFRCLKEIMHQVKQQQKIHSKIELIRDICTRLTQQQKPQNMTSWNGNILSVTGPLWGEPPFTVMRGFDVFFSMRLNERMSKQSRRLWFGTPLPSLWHKCDDNYIVRGFIGPRIWHWQLSCV